ncbi:hypothetical protein GGR57DRAFT_496649 [Xylariaceae sp. FL1272]|nr:hypothetical protein GGR57DRAFT_496649 [Xylariaceae sp. FL1272]
MSRASILRPIRQSLSRPLAGQSRHVLPGLVTTRSHASIVDEDAKPPQLLNEQPNPIDAKSVRYPRAVQAVYLQPLRREAEYGVPSCDLQLRSYSIPNLEFFCDFALRAAYYLGLPAFGPVPLPKITERWTVPRSHFIFKKSQENFERITRRRLIQIRDGHPETVQIWLAFLQKHAYYGIGMKANMWEYCSLDAGKEMDSETQSMQKAIDEKIEMLGANQVLGTVEKVKEMMASEKFQATFKNGHYKLREQNSATRRLLFSLQKRNNSDEASQPKHGVIFSGIQPTGVPHLGNYLGALKQWKLLQDHAGPDDRLYFSIVDLHAITMPQDAEQLRNRRREMLACLLAIGLDPEKCTLFYQSSVKQHAELMWILSCSSSMGYLGRMTQYKSKLQSTNKQGNLEHAMDTRLKLGLFSYPVLQAADILVHRATHVPVGDDQRQHLEFARECVTNFRHTYDSQALVPPETITAPSARVMSLTNPTEKMSKSALRESSRITITASEPEIRKYIMGARTDNTDYVSYDPVNRPGVSNLLDILAQCSSEPMTPKEALDSLSTGKNKELKVRTAEAVVNELAGIRERYREVLARNGGKYLADVEAAGAQAARRNAEETMVLVRQAVGLAY